MPYSITIPTTITIEDVAALVRKYAHRADLDMVWLAYDVANRAHTGQNRQSGEPYIVHPLAAAYILAGMRIDVSIIVAALLHDVPEDTTVTLEAIENDFGPDVAGMVRGITKLGKLKYRGAER